LRTIKRVIYASVGIHPHEAQLAKHSDSTNSAAWRGTQDDCLGEIGLDYFYDHSPRPVQKSVFLRQMELARAARLPIIIHCRPTDNTENAWDDLLAMIGSTSVQRLGGIIHCLHGKLDHMKRALDLGFMISFAGQHHFPGKHRTFAMPPSGSAPNRMLIGDRLPFSGSGSLSRKRNDLHTSWK